MDVQFLNGIWQYRIGKGRQTEVKVPYSALAVGHSECEKTFDLEKFSDRIFLKFDRITYHAVVKLNDSVLGEMLPYSEYEFEITDVVKAKNNVLLVELEDLLPEFGPSAGWENYGGIIGSVSLIYRGKNYITDAFFYTELTNDYKDAVYTVETDFCDLSAGEYSVKLYFNEDLVDEYLAKTSSRKISREIKNVKLWSPDNPNLYRLEVELFSNEKSIDMYTVDVGFREFKCDKHRFILNGKPIFLQGVCRHETLLDYGHTVPFSEVLCDMQKIKDAGCNFVRLVHYPHDKQVLKIADRLGLMVSEEPGLWWSDTANEEISNGSLEVLRRTIKRDRNHPSIIFWLAFNECRFTEKYLIDAVNTARANDPTRLVSGANCMSVEDTLLYYNKCGFDFYTMHPYSDTFERAKDSARRLNDKPLMFTEWGGYYLYDNPHLTADFIKEMYSLYEQNSDDGALAGASFWFWREVNDFSRGEPACIDGTLTEALVLKDGNKTAIYDAFVNTFKEVKIRKSVTDKYECKIRGSLDGKTPLTCTDKTAVNSLIAKFNLRQRAMEEMRYRKVSVGPILRENIQGLNNTPFVVSDGKTVEFDGTVLGDTLTIIGCVSAPMGYPISGEYGEDAYIVTIEFCDGTTKLYTLKNGVHFTNAFTVFASSRINPVAEETTPFATFSYDKNFESDIINKLEIKFLQTKMINKVFIKSLNKGYDLLIYGVFA
jgi:beta-glucuronidase